MKVGAVHGQRVITADPVHEVELAAHLRSTLPVDARVELYGRFVDGESAFDAMMRRVLWRALARHVGDGLRVERGARFRHPETFHIDEGVFIGEYAVIQGRIDGTCRIGRHAWIGAHAFLDARNLTVGEYVGWGPGAKVLGSTHTGEPRDVPIIQTELDIRPVTIEPWADIGVNAVVLPGVVVGRASIVGAGAVVTADVPAHAIAAGVPAKVLRYRDDVPRE